MALPVVLVRQGHRFSARYVEVVTAQIRAFHEKQRVVTLTDQADTPGETAPLRTPLHGWWAKMEMFAPWSAGLRPCLYLDLDTYVLAPIHDLLEPATELWLIRDFMSPRRSNSGVMRLPEDTSEIWRAFGNSDAFGGDGDFLTRCRHRVLQDAHDGIVSYKVHCDTSGPPAGARIVCFHGRPKPPETDGWARDIWDDRRGP